MSYKYLSVIFGSSSTASSYLIVCSYFLFITQVVFFLIGLLILFDYIFWAFSSKYNVMSISPSKKWTSVLDTLFVISISCYILALLLSSIGFIYNLVDFLAGVSSYEVIDLSLVGSQWYWNTVVITDMLDPFTFETIPCKVENTSIYSTDSLKRSQSSTVVIVPVGSTVLFKGTSSDVIHSFGIPSAGIKFDCVPGRSQVFQTTFTKTGYYDAHCYELCGANHAHMQLTICVVSKMDSYLYMLLQPFMVMKDALIK